MVQNIANFVRQKPLAVIAIGLIIVAIFLTFRNGAKNNGEPQEPESMGGVRGDDRGSSGRRAPSPGDSSDHESAGLTAVG